MKTTESNVAKLAQKLSASKKQASEAQNELEIQKQELANLKRADLISRLANNKIQAELAEKDEQIALLAKAMGHPARVAIIRLLLKKQTCICGI